MNYDSIIQNRIFKISNYEDINYYYKNYSNNKNKVIKIDWDKINSIDGLSIEIYNQIDCNDCQYGTNIDALRDILVVWYPHIEWPTLFIIYNYINMFKGNNSLYKSIISLFINLINEHDDLYYTIILTDLKYK